MRPTFLLFVLIGIVGCRSMTTTRPLAPIPAERAFTLGGSWTASAGIQTGVYLEHNDVGAPYAALLGGGIGSLRLGSLGDFSLELDAGVGAATETTAANLTLGPGGLLAVRAWWNPAGPFAFGAELATTVGADLFSARTPLPESVWIQPEVRAVAAWRVIDSVWLTTRPGLLHQLGFADGRRLVYPPVGFAWPYLDLPFGVVADFGSLRLGMEMGAAVTLFPLPFPSVRGGASLAWMW